MDVHLNNYVNEIENVAMQYNEHKFMNMHACTFSLNFEACGYNKKF